MTSILLVEDDAEMIGLLSRFLPQEGYELRVASDMAATLRAVSEREPDIILLDIVLGDEDGRDIFREVRELSDVPAIFLTGRGLESDRIAGLKMGADDYIVKPFSPGELSAPTRLSTPSTPRISSSGPSRSTRTPTKSTSTATCSN